MRIRINFLGLAVIASLFVLGAETTARGAPEDTVQSKTAKTRKDADGIALRKGMTADAVRGMAGAPKEIKLFKSPDGPCEVWIYRAIVGEQNRLVTADVASITTFASAADSGGGRTTDVAVPVQRMEHRSVEEVTMLTLLNNRLVEWKQFQVLLEPTLN